MGSESPEVQMARLEERLKTMMQWMAEAKNDQKANNEFLIKMEQSIIAIGSRVQGVEESLAKASPTIDEFITIKHKVVGAGIMGKWVWAIGGGIIGMLFAARETIISMVTK